MNYIAAKYAQFVRWACWNAWDYARRREITRRGSEFGVSPIPAEMGEMSPVQRRSIAGEARQLLENRHFREALGAVDSALEAQANSCDPDDKGKAQRVIIAKQLMVAIRREIVRKAEDGYMAEVEIAEIERRRGLLKFVR